MTAGPHTLKPPGPGPLPVAARAFSVRRPLLLGFLTLAILCGGAVGWGAFASLAGAVIAVGQVEVESRDQVVEHFDGGTVGAILAQDGDQVEAGQVLVRLSGEELQSEAALLEAELAELVARRNRLEAEFGAAEAIAWDAALVLRAGTSPAVAAVLAGQRRLFRARRAARAGQVAQLRERIGQMNRQIAGLAAQRAAVTRQSGFLDRDLTVRRKLFDQGLVELHGLLALEREAAALDGQSGDIAARIAEARGRIAEVELQILQVGAQRIEEAEERAREVFGMRVSTLGEVVRPGEPILQIVPAGAALVVRAQVEPIHVDQVHPGQEAVLRFSAFPARTTPEYGGRVVRVSADAQPDERTGLSWYEVELSMGAAVEPDPDTGSGTPDGKTAMSPGWAPAHARDLALTPGMPVEVYLRTGARSPLSYLAKPLTDYFARSLKEE